MLLECSFLNVYQSVVRSITYSSLYSMNDYNVVYPKEDEFYVPYKLEMES